MKYIDAEKLIAEIDKLESFSCLSEEQDGFYSAISRINGIIDSLQQEQPEVDLEKEINSLDDTYFDLDGIAVVGATYYITVEDLKDIARHFYELGFNARKE